MLLAYRCALACERISAAAVEATAFPTAADRHGVVSVPAIVANDRLAWVGSVHERTFVEYVIRAAEGLP